MGVVLGIAVTGAAQETTQRKVWQSTEMMLQTGDSEQQKKLKELFKVGYIEGMADTLATIEVFLDTASKHELSLVGFRIVMQKQITCFRSHGQGTNDEFLRWADGVWRARMDKGSGTFAAGDLFSDACK
jgi:hypothetical protein